MKKIVSLAILLGGIHLASAGTTNIYVENWGTGNSGVTGNGNINTVGWTGVAVSQTTGPFMGIYVNGDGPVDISTGAPLPVNTVYFTVLLPTQDTPGMFYTTSTNGAGIGGNSTFTNIDPATKTNLTLNVEVAGGNNATNYFAVQVGGSWYISATPMAGLGAGGDAVFTNTSLLYTNAASAWNNLTVGTTNVTIGGPAGGPLVGAISGVGVVELPTTGGWNYNQFSISVFASNPPPPTPASITGNPISQTVYAGGGAQFRMSAAGTAPITYIWQTNSVVLANGSKYAGANTNLLVISNCSSADAAATYSITVSNAGTVGTGATNTSPFTLTVNPVPSGWLYAETFPYVGLSGNPPVTGVGWVNAESAGTSGIFSIGTGLGAVFSFSGSVVTKAFYTTTSNDVGQSGLPFVPIDPTSVPAVTLQAAFSPGNGAGTVPGNVTVYWAVQMAGSNWYSTVQPLAIDISSQNNYLTNQLAFNAAASNWNNLTIAGNSVTIGSAASSPLTGNITGAGMVITHNNTSGASMDWENFAVTTNPVVIVPPTINSAVGLYNQSIPTGGGASFAVATSGGTLPFTYRWTLNGVTLTNGGRISGATTPTVTIANCTTNDTDTSGGVVGNIVAYVTNAIGQDKSDNYFPVSLFVTNPPVGQLFLETFPYVGPTGNRPITGVGWTEAVSGTPNTVFERTPFTGEGAVFAFLGSAGTTVYYATTATDTNQSGMLFPIINPAFYPDLTFSVDIAPATANPSNVAAYFAVRLGTNWYASATALPTPTTSNSTYATYTLPYNPVAANWNNLTVTSSGGVIGSGAASNLTGQITAAGMVFKTVNSGGTFNFDNFLISASGLGGINVGAINGGNLPLSWIGNPAVNLQSSTNLSFSNWVDVPNTLGLYSFPAPVSGGQKYFRLVKH
jgi:hypothetical protein